MQLLSYVMPLVLVPYVSRTVGIERYGITEFSVEIALFFGVMLLFGYDFTMSRKLSQNRSDSVTVNSLFWNVFYSRLLLSTIVLPAFTGIGLFFLSDLFTLEILLYCGLFVASRIFSSWWFYQGLEKIKWIAWGNFLSKLILLVWVLSTVHDQEDYPLVVFGYAFSQLAVNFLSWILLIKMEKLHAIVLKIRDVLRLIESSLYIFLNEFAVVGFAALYLLLVKEYLSPVELGIYVSAMKIVIISHNLVIQSLSKSLFPNLALTLKNNRQLYLAQLKKFRFYLGGFLLLLGLGIILLRSQIVYILFGPEFREVSSYLVYIAFLPFFKGMTNIHGWQGLYVIEKERAMAGITFAVGVITLAFLFWAIPNYGVSGALAVRNLHEFLLMVSTAYFFNRLWKTEGLR